MARTGKIARCPRPIREELNRRLENGEPGVQLIPWLNSLPEVKQMLETCFEGKPIDDGNLTHWKQGGFRDWLAHQEARAYVQDSNGDTAELAKPLATTLLDEFAAAISGSNGDEGEDPRDRARRLGKSMREVVRVLRCDQGQQRVGIQRERLALAREWLELEKSKFENHKSNPQATKASQPATADFDSMSREEKSAFIKKTIYGD